MISTQSKTANRLSVSLIRRSRQGKRRFTLLLALAMIFTTISGITLPVSAEMLTIGDFAALRDTINNAPTNGEPINITIAADLNFTDEITISNGQNIIINGKGYTFMQQASADDARHFNINTGGMLTTVNLTLDGNNTGGGILNTGNAVLTDVTIQNCKGSNNGGMCNDHSSATLINCTFANNATIGLATGGGMLNINSSPTLINCTFTNNTANNGGGMFNANSSPMLTNCKFVGNNARSSGGGVLNLNSNPTLVNCTFVGNKAMSSGGGMNNFTNSSPLLTNCRFTNNTANNFGGGMQNNSNAPILINCMFTGNNATSGGGIYGNADSTTLINCAFTGNNATSYGGGMYNGNGSNKLINCTFTGNEATYSGGGIENFISESTVLTNCIVTLNHTNNSPEENVTNIGKFASITSSVIGTSFYTDKNNSTAISPAAADFNTDDGGLKSSAVWAIKKGNCNAYASEISMLAAYPNGMFSDLIPEIMRDINGDLVVSGTGGSKTIDLGALRYTANTTEANEAKFPEPVPPKPTVIAYADNGAYVSGALTNVDVVIAVHTDISSIDGYPFLPQHYIDSLKLCYTIGGGSKMEYTSPITAVESGEYRFFSKSADEISEEAFLMVSIDSLKPMVTNVTPANGAANLDIDGDIVITFNKTIAAVGTVTLNGEDLSNGLLTSSSVINDTYTIGYSGVLYDTTYTIGISGFTDAVGNVMDTDNSYSFTTKVEPTYGVALSQTGAYTFEDVTYGYGAIEPLEVTVTNAGNQATGALSAVLSGTNQTSFIITENNIGNGMDVSGTANFKIAPVHGLSEGTYNAAVTVGGADGNNNSITPASFNVNFTVSKAAQATLSITGLGSNYTYGDSTFKLSTAGGSGNGAVSYTSSDTSVASVLADTVTIHKAGTFAITATKAADSNYVEASVVSGVATVRAATPNLSLTASGGSDANEDIILTATVSAVGAGLVPDGTVTFKEDGITLGTEMLDAYGRASYTVTAPLTSGGHIYTAVYDGQTDYYNTNSDTDTRVVGAADQTELFITGVPSEITYGDGGFTLGYTGGSGTGDVTFSVPADNGVLNITSGGAIMVIGAGTVMVTGGKAADISYNETTTTLPVTVAPRDISHVTITVTGDRVYAGSQLQPIFDVSDGSISIDAGDYANDYGSNVNAGRNGGSITLLGQRNYTGTKTVCFDITPKDISSAIIEDIAEQTYMGSAIEPTVTVRDEIGTLALNTDYTVAYQNNTSIGTATVTITGAGNYDNTASKNFDIVGGAVVKHDLTVSADNGGYIYEGSDGQYQAGTPITVTAVAYPDYSFSGWTVNGITVPNSSTISFLMPANDVTLTAHWRYNGGYTPASKPSTSRPAPVQTPAIAAHGVDISYSIDEDGVITAAPVEQQIKDVITNADGRPIVFDFSNVGDITGIVFVVDPKWFDGAGDVMILMANGYSLTISDGMMGELVNKYGGMVEFRLLMGSITLLIMQDGKEIDWYNTEFPVTLTMPYTLIAGQKPGATVAVKKDGDIETILPYSVYRSGNSNSDGFMTFKAVATGTYDAIYNTRSFTDIMGHWATDYIEFVTARHIFNGTDVNQFNPEGSMSRAMFAMALANLDGVDLSTYKSCRFKDVPDGTWYTAAVEWAAEKGIVTGNGGGLFDPDATVTREQMAVMLYNYIKYKGYVLPQVPHAIVFTDEDKIRKWVSEAVKSMYQMGTISGKPVRTGLHQTAYAVSPDVAYDPQGIGTRAEVTVIFARFIELCSL